MNTTARTISALLPLGLVWLPGCNAGEAETTSVVEEALSPLAQCPGRDPDRVIQQHTTSETVVSPTTYGTTGCPKSWIVDSTPNAFVEDEDYFLDWTDPWLRNPPQCTGGKLKLTAMSRGTRETLFRSEGTFEAPLAWDADSQRCSYSRIQVNHGAPGPTGDPPDEWSVVTYRQTFNGGLFTQTSKTIIRQLGGRTLRVVASALTPAGSTQSVSVTAQ